MARRSPKTSGGDCYQAAANFVMNRDHNRYVLVHAEVAGQGMLEGTNFGHAFVLDKETNTVIDQSNGRDIRLPAVIYYALGRINEIGNVKEYTWEQAATKMLDTGIFGPWDLETSTGL